VAISHHCERWVISIDPQSDESAIELQHQRATMNLNPMPEQPEDYEPTETDMDMVIEEATGKPVKPADLAAGIASIRQRIAQLEAEKTKLLDRWDTATDESAASLNQHLASLNKDLATARERLSHYEAQLGRQN